MGKNHRIVLFLLILGLALVLGLLFPSFVKNNVIAPVALVIWLFVRVFVLTIDQKIYWGALIFIVLFLALRRLNQGPETVEQPRPWVNNTALENVKTWRTCLRYTSDEVEDQNTVKRELVKLLVSMYSTQMHTSIYYKVHEDLKQRQIPLPASIYDFIFSDERTELGFFIHRFLYAIRRAPSKWARKVTGRAEAEYYRSIDEVLMYIETSMEIENDES